MSFRYITSLIFLISLIAPLNGVKGKLISNQINHAFSITDLHLLSPKPSNYLVSGNDHLSIWRSYGPLKVNWTEWRISNDSYVAPAINDKAQELYVAVNCKSKLLNISSTHLSWKGWLPPEHDFEKLLIEDFCTQILIK